MKKTTILSLVYLLALLVFVQSCKTPAKTTSATIPPTIIDTAQTQILTTLNDSASYAIGMSVASFYKQQGISEINTTLLSQAVKDIFGNKKTQLDDALANNLMNRYMNKIQEEKSKPNMMAGEKFLAENKVRPGVKTTASGLQYEILKETTGPKPAAIDTFVAHYKGTLLDGTEVDNSITRGQPLTYPVRGVIPGWTEGLQLMSIGSKYKFYIPYTLGYGAFDYGSIPGGSALIFEVELLDIKKIPGALKQGN